MRRLRSVRSGEEDDRMTMLEIEWCLRLPVVVLESSSHQCQSPHPAFRIENHSQNACNRIWIRNHSNMIKSFQTCRIRNLEKIKSNLKAHNISNISKWTAIHNDVRMWVNEWRPNDNRTKLFCLINVMSMAIVWIIIMLGRNQQNKKLKKIYSKPASVCASVFSTRSSSNGQMTQRETTVK